MNTEKRELSGAERKMAQRYLKSMSPKTFVNCFETAYKAYQSGASFTQEDVENCDCDVEGLQTKASSIKRVFKDGVVHDVLLYCTTARFHTPQEEEKGKSPEELREYARELYEKYYGEKD